MRLAPYLHAFENELEKIAEDEGTAGAMIGAGLGAVLSKNKLKGGAYGAIAGGLIGKGVGATSRLHDKLLENGPASYGPPTGDPDYVPTWQRGYQR